jgi:hypothetical protein
MPLEAAGTLYGTGGSFGVPSVQTSPYGELLNMAGKLGGTYVGNEMFKRQFPGQKPALPAPRYFDE